MRRLARLSAVIGVFSIVAACLALTAGAAGAAPYSTVTQAKIMTSTTTPFQGQTIEVSGKDFHKNETVKLYIGGIFVGTAHTDAHGAFDPPVVVPKQLVGKQALTGVGASGKSDDRDSLTLTIRVNHGVAGASTSAPGGTAFTGVKVAGLTVVALAFLVGGAVLATVGRRRKNATHA